MSRECNPGPWLPQSQSLGTNSKWWGQQAAAGVPDKTLRVLVPFSRENSNSLSKSSSPKAASPPQEAPSAAQLAAQRPREYFEARFLSRLGKGRDCPCPFKDAALPLATSTKSEARHLECAPSWQAKWATSLAWHGDL